MYLKSNRLSEAEDVQRKVMQIMELSKVQHVFSNSLMLNCSLLAFFLSSKSFSQDAALLCFFLPRRVLTELILLVPDNELSCNMLC